MLSNSSLHKTGISRWVIFVLIAILMIGIIFRFTNIGKKPYWRDETATLTRVAGYTWTEVAKKLYNGQIISIEAVQKTQTTNDKKTTLDTIKSLAQDEPQHTPLYFVITRFWVQILGNSPAVVRTLTAIISVLTLPCIYWLCWELFESPSVAWIAIALISVSLQHLMYAQEARPYSLWLLIVVISNASLLRAIRLKNNRFWGVYAISLLMGFYTSILMLPIALGQGIYTIIYENFQLTKPLKKYLISSSISLVLFSPWLLIIWFNHSALQNTTEHLVKTESTHNKSSLVFQWLLNTSYIFISSRPRVYFFILLFIGFSIYFLCLHAPKKIKLFILILICSVFIPLAFVDLFSGSILSTKARYLFSYYLGIQLSVAYLLDSLIKSHQVKKAWHKWLGLLLLLTILFIGLWTCNRYIQADKGWNKGDGEEIEIAKIVNQSPHPLIVRDITLNNGKLLHWEDVGVLQQVAHVSKSNIHLLLTIEPNVPNIPDNFSDVFLLYPSPFLNQKFQTQGNYKIEKISRVLNKLVKND